ncbi:MAG: helix-turn-helix domain-containing protein [Gammaproteobacteria bacterium]
MSVDATRWAWQQTVKPTQKLILLSLADRADEHFVCYPSIQRIIRDTGFDRKTVIRALQALEADGLIETIRALGEVNHYRLVQVPDRHGTSPKSGTSPKTGTGIPPQEAEGPVPKLGHESINRT